MKSVNASFFRLMLAAALISGCKKELNAPITKPAEIFASSKHANVESKCRLTYLNWPTAAIFQFHYNEKGLADQWIVDYGSGLPLHTNNMTYDDENRLIQSKEVLFGLNYVYDFFYSNNRISRLRRSSVEFPELGEDYLLTYNSKGDVIREDDDKNDVHVLMSYDAMGNCLQTDVYFGDYLFFSDIYTFEQSARNPELNIPGVTFAFPFFGGTFISNKRWFTSNRTVYDGNTLPFIFNNYDPSQTDISVGNHHFPNSANYYDLISEAPINIIFGYENCDGSGKPVSPLLQTPNSVHTEKLELQASPMLMRHSKLLLLETIQKIKQNRISN